MPDPYDTLMSRGNTSLVDNYLTNSKRDNLADTHKLVWDQGFYKSSRDHMGLEYSCLFLLPRVRLGVGVG